MRSTTKRSSGGTYTLIGFQSLVRDHALYHVGVDIEPQPQYPFFQSLVRDHALYHLAKEGLDFMDSKTFNRSFAIMRSTTDEVVFDPIPFSIFQSLVRDHALYH